MPKYEVTLEVGSGKTTRRTIEADGIQHDPFYVNFLNTQQVQNVKAEGATAYMIAMIPRERVVLIERGE